MLKNIGIVFCAFAFLLEPLSAKPKRKIIKRKPVVVKTQDLKQKPIIKPPVVEGVTGISKYALKMEQDWRLLDSKISYLTRRISENYSEINSQNRAFANNISQLNGSDGNSETAFISNYKQIANKRYKDIAQKCDELKKLESEIKQLKSKQCAIARKADRLARNIERNSKVSNNVLKLITDTIDSIAEKAQSIPDLLTKIDLELSAGVFRSLTKCTSGEPQTYPVEPVLVRKEFNYFNNKQFKLITSDITTRANSFVFSPCFGTVVFFKHVKTLGNTLVINNSTSTVVICGVDCSKYCAVGEVLRKGQIIGKACSSCGEHSDIKYVVRTKNRKLSEKA